jgi:hypothetical protein
LFPEHLSDCSLPTILIIPPEDIGNYLTANTAFLTACTLLSLTADDIAAATYAGTGQQGKTLVRMVQNWNAATHILAVFRVSPTQQSHQFSGGFQATYLGVLGELQWGSLSYGNKAKWYPWAQSASLKSWRNPVPGKFLSVHLELLLDSLNLTHRCESP